MPTITTGPPKVFHLSASLDRSRKLSSKNHTSITISAFETESLFSLVFFLFPSQTHIYKIGREFYENGNELETCKSLLVFLEKKGVELKKIFSF